MHLWFGLCCSTCQTQACYSSLIPSGIPRTKSSSKHAWIPHIWRSSKTEDSSPDSLHNSQQLYISFSHLELMTGNKMPVFPGTETHCRALSHHSCGCYRPDSSSYVRSKHFTRSTTWKQHNLKHTTKWLCQSLWCSCTHTAKLFCTSGHFLAFIWF